MRTARSRLVGPRAAPDINWFFFFKDFFYGYRSLLLAVVVVVVVWVGFLYHIHQGWAKTGPRATRCVRPAVGLLARGPHLIYIDFFFFKDFFLWFSLNRVEDCFPLISTLQCTDIECSNFFQDWESYETWFPVFLFFLFHLILILPLVSSIHPSIHRCFVGCIVLLPLPELFQSSSSSFLPFFSFFFFYFCVCSVVFVCVKSHPPVVN